MPGKSTRCCASGLTRTPPISAAPTAAAARDFCLRLIEATADHAAAFKPNAAFFEALGPDGWAVLREVIDAVPEGVPMILDAKRGDIASTAEAYAQSAFAGLGARCDHPQPVSGPRQPDAVPGRPAARRLPAVQNLESGRRRPAGFGPGWIQPDVVGARGRSGLRLERERQPGTGRRCDPSRRAAPGAPDRAGAVDPRARRRRTGRRAGCGLARRACAPMGWVCSSR